MLENKTTTKRFFKRPCNFFLNVLFHVQPELPNACLEAWE